ncbi:odorant receptor 13a-like [Wyeomyia smithii]|uniref:odorant receptor 13a-like n=1 Tax=Wyeomyia smithii TaxID=174621 RepID=UPI00246814B3|nr:odorant receptor 13a-like [Wyeomyia smithii]
MKLARLFSPRRRVLQLGLKLLQRISLWGDNHRFKYTYVLLSSFIAITWLIPKIIFGSGKDGFESFLRNIAEIFFLTENFIALGCFVLRRRSFERLVDVLERIFNRHWPDALRVEIDAIIQELEKASRSYATYMSTMLVIFVVSPVLFTVMKIVLWEEAERGDFVLINETQFYWLDVRRNSVHYCIFTTLCFVASSCSAYILTLKGSLFQVIIRYGYRLFELVTKRIASMAQLDQVDERRAELREIIQLHQMALEYLEHLESTMSFILLNQTLSCLLVWCLMLFYVSSNFGLDAANVLILFIVLLVEMYVFCKNGTILSEKAAEVANAIYFYDWYMDPVDLQQKILLIIQQAQKPTGITAARFYYINIQRFGATAQATYSYYLILKNRF